MSVSTTRSNRSLRLFGMRPGAHFCGRMALFGLLIGLSLPAAGQEQPFSHVDDEILHLTPVSRQLDYIRFLPSLGALKPMHAHTEYFYFDNVLLPAATWMDDDPDSSVKRHLATASDIRHSVLPQINPHRTLSLLLNGNGETPLDSEEGQAGFRSNGPSLSGASNSDPEVPISGSWTAIPLVLTLSRLVLRSHRRRRRDREA
jgi:hypothetical protein